jgi:hypothetical protein
MTRSKQQAATQGDKNNVQEVSKINEPINQRVSALHIKPTQEPPQSPKLSVVEKTEGLGKTNVTYWKTRLYKNTFTSNGQRFAVKEWCVKIQHLGCRKTFSLKSGNKDVAAAKAKEIYLAVVSQGWAAADSVYNPEMIARKDDPSLGDFLAEVKNKASLNPKTFRNYASSFRTIVGGIMRRSDDKTKFDYRTGGQKNWTASIDSIRLSAITPDRVQAWKVAYPLSLVTARHYADAPSDRK